MNTIQSIICLLELFVVISAESSYIEGYYWRDYYGEVPSDALKGGSDKNGNPIYIGQILHGDKLLTAKIYKNNPNGYYGLSKREYSGTKNLKILCTRYPDKFIWLQTTTDDIHLLTNTHLIVGGYEPGYTMYIGRAFYDSETLVGKVSTGKTSNGKTLNLGLYVTSEGEELNIKSFEILSYDPNQIVLHSPQIL